MKLPNGHQAIVDMAKLRHYCLSFDHPRGRHKARRFLSALGMTEEDAGELRIALLQAAAESTAASEGDVDRFGRRYVIEFDYARLNGRCARIRSAWIIRTNETTPRLTTCYVV